MGPAPEPVGSSSEKPTGCPAGASWSPRQNGGRWDGGSVGLNLDLALLRIDRNPQSPATPSVRGCFLCIHLKRRRPGNECPLTSFSLSRLARIAFRCRPYVPVVGRTPLVLSAFTPPRVVGRITPFLSQLGMRPARVHPLSCWLSWAVSFFVIDMTWDR